MSKNIPLYGVYAGNGQWLCGTCEKSRFFSNIKKDVENSIVLYQKELKAIHESEIYHGAKAKLYTK